MSDHSLSLRDLQISSPRDGCAGDREESASLEGDTLKEKRFMAGASRIIGKRTEDSRVSAETKRTPGVFSEKFTKLLI